MANIMKFGGGGNNVYTLTISTPTNASDLKVERTVSGVGRSDQLGYIDETDIIFYGDVLVVTANPYPLYGDTSPYVVSSREYTVTGDTTVTVDVSYIGYPTYENATWSYVKYVANEIKNGTRSISTVNGVKQISTVGWKVGDTRTITVQGESDNHTVRIIDFQHWDCGINFQFTDSLDAGVIMNATTTSYTWDNMYLRTWLNDTFISYLPTDISDNLSKSTVLTTAGNTSTVVRSTQEYITIPAAIEIWGTILSTATGYYIAGEGSQLNYYEVSTESTIEADSSKVITTTAGTYPTGTSSSKITWTRSPSLTTTNWNTCISSSGSITKQMNTVARGVCPVFSF